VRLLLDTSILGWVCHPRKHKQRSNTRDPRDDAQYVLDTNIVARLLDRDPRVAARMATVDTDDFDLVIACTALEHAAALITNDGSLKDGAIEGLVVEDWLR
jgi:predicted nucleic acid-binding protein